MMQTRQSSDLMRVRSRVPSMIGVVANTLRVNEAEPAVFADRADRFHSSDRCCRLLHASQMSAPAMAYPNQAGFGEVTAGTAGTPQKHNQRPRRPFEDSPSGV